MKFSVSLFAACLIYGACSHRALLAEERIVYGLGLPVQVSIADANAKALTEAGFSSSAEFINEFYQNSLRLSWISQLLTALRSKEENGLAIRKEDFDRLDQAILDFQKASNLAQNQKINEAGVEKWANVQAKGLALSQSISRAKIAQTFPDQIWILPPGLSLLSFQRNADEAFKMGRLGFSTRWIDGKPIDLLGDENIVQEGFNSQFPGWPTPANLTMKEWYTRCYSELLRGQEFQAKISKLDFNQLHGGWGPFNDVEKNLSTYRESYTAVQEILEWRASENFLPNGNSRKSSRINDPFDLYASDAALRLEKHLEPLASLAEEARAFPSRQVLNGLTSSLDTISHQFHLLNEDLAKGKALAIFPAYNKERLSSLAELQKLTLSAVNNSSVNQLLLENEAKTLSQRKHALSLELSEFLKLYQTIYENPASPWRKSFDSRIDATRTSALKAPKDLLAKYEFVSSFHQWFEDLRIEMVAHRFENAKILMRDFENRIKKLESSLKLQENDKETSHAIAVAKETIRASQAYIERTQRTENVRSILINEIDEMLACAKPQTGNFIHSFILNYVPTIGIEALHSKLSRDEISASEDFLRRSQP